MNHSRKPTLIAFAAVTLLTVGCAKKKIAMAPPSAPAPASLAAPSKPAPSPPQAAVAQRPAATVAPARKYPDAATRTRIDQLLARIEDAYFDYDQATLRPDALKALQADSTELRDILKDFPDYKLTIEGHCDERGSAEYNMALGDRRAAAAQEYLVAQGIPKSQLVLTSYGKENQVCAEHTEECWQKNRRAHIVAMAQ
jgi:peptidoglycan-associated lipoprotein